MLSVREPFAGLFTQGMVTHETYRRQNGEWVEPREVEIRSEGATRRACVVATGEPLVIGDVEKMSKSKRNVVAPADIADTYGVDAARLFVLSDSPPERDVQWTTAGVEGAWRLVNRVWAEFDQPTPAMRRRRRGRWPPRPAPRDPPADQGGHRSHRGLPLQQRHRPALRVRRAVREARPPRRRRLVARARGAVAPWPGWSRPSRPTWPRNAGQRLGEPGLVALAPWPACDPALAEDDERVLPVQINGKRRGEIRAPRRARRRGRWRRSCLTNAEIARRLEGLTVRKVIVVPGPHRQHRGGIAPCARRRRIRWRSPWRFAPLLGGCGFTPLYATPGVGLRPAAIEVVAPQGRVGLPAARGSRRCPGPRQGRAPA